MLVESTGVPIRFGLVGCGNIALRHGQILSSLPETKLTAVADIDAVRGKHFAERFGAEYYCDFRKMLNCESLDCVVVLTPSGTHAEVALECMRHGKSVLVEKPLALCSDDARRMTEAATDLGTSLFVVHQNRFNPPVLRLKQAIESGRVGRLALASARLRWCRPQHYYDQASWRGTWAYDGGVFANQAVHHIDLLQWLVGPIESVIARGGHAMANIEAEDVGVAILKFASGGMGSIEATTCARPRDIESSISILGEKATVEVDGTHLDRIGVWEFSEPLPEEEAFVRAFSHSPNEFTKQGHLKVYEALINSIKTGNSGHLATSQEAQSCVDVLVAIYESMLTGSEVSVRDGTRVSRLGKRSMLDGSDLQTVSQPQDWAGSGDRGLLSHRSAAQGA